MNNKQNHNKTANLDEIKIVNVGTIEESKEFKFCLSLTPDDEEQESHKVFKGVIA